MNAYNYDEAQQAANFIKKFLTGTPATAIVAGSGLGDIADVIENKIITVSNR